MKHRATRRPRELLRECAVFLRSAVFALLVIVGLCWTFASLHEADAAQGVSPPIQLPPPSTPNPPPPTVDNASTIGLADQFFEGTLRSAHAEANRLHRLLIVYYCDPGHLSCAAIEKNVWQNPIVRAWIAWHAVLYRPTHTEIAELKRRYGIGDHRIADSLTQGIGRPLPEGPVFYFFAYGRFIDVWKIPQPEEANLTRNPPRSRIHNIGSSRTPHPQCSSLSDDRIPNRPGGVRASGALMYFDFTLRRAMQTDVIFALRHEQYNPEPIAPPRPDPLWQTGDEWAPSLAESLDSLGLDPSHVLDDPLEFLLRARRLVQDGFSRDAVTHFTWLWNRTDERAPWLRAWRRTVVQADIAELTGLSESAQKRFDTLRSIETHRLAWAQWPELYDWMLLSYASGKPDDVFQYAWAIVIPEDGALTTMLEFRVHRAMLARSNLANPWELPPGDPVKRASDLWTLASMGHTRHSTEKELAEAREFLRELAHDECCRLHAACLLASRDADAQRIAELLVSRAEEPSDALVSMLAVAIGARITIDRLGHVISPIADDDRALRLLAWSAELDREPR